MVTPFVILQFFSVTRFHTASLMYHGMLFKLLSKDSD